MHYWETTEYSIEIKSLEFSKVMCLYEHEAIHTAGIRNQSSVHKG